MIPRLVILLLVTAGHLLLLRSGPGPAAADWGFALAAVAIGMFGAVRPLGTALGLAALLLAADAYGGSFAHGPAAVVKYLAGFSLLELAVRRPWPRALLGGAALTAVYAVHTADGMPAELPPLLYRVAVTVLGPLLLGSTVRAARRAARHARKCAEEERQGRELRVRAARVAERAAIARELHDLVAHHVSSMVLRAGVARHTLPVTDDRVTGVLDDLHTTGTAALADLRRLVAVLRDPGQLPGDGGEALPPVPGGLPAALRTAVERGRRIGLDVEESTDPETGRLDAVRGLAVLRLVQEGLANVARHAGPSARATVSVRMTGAGAVTVDIRDHGPARGAGRAGPAPSGTGLGLIGMRERVRLLGGSLRAGPAGDGWHLTAELPADPGDAAGPGDPGAPGHGAGRPAPGCPDGVVDPALPAVPARPGCERADGRREGVRP
ncbi:two-component sensor histidine kinase [Streptomyces sp. F63]|uniref:sensor histidine kinase n=1 Tax=Streptomyces sp. F63 TaxID=2824887 RepID=UPI001B3706B8|nr:histidine kinase [Streptomyces sp. F63]MBQ0985350.1 two-component sensor histidine kinase [Streptomyces sp. F63]